MIFVNACKLGPQTEEEEIKLNWSKMDFMAARYIERFDKKTSLEWFAKQPEEWKKSRANKFHARMSGKR